MKATVDLGCGLSLEGFAFFAVRKFFSLGLGVLCLLMPCPRSSYWGHDHAPPEQTSREPSKVPLQILQDARKWHVIWDGAACRFGHGRRALRAEFQHLGGDRGPTVESTPVEIDPPCSGGRAKWLIVFRPRLVMILWAHNFNITAPAFICDENARLRSRLPLIGSERAMFASFRTDRRLRTPRRRESKAAARDRRTTSTWRCR
jgi:hypothetical protein